jgi:hypothetical protein
LASAGKASASYASAPKLTSQPGPWDAQRMATMLRSIADVGGFLDATVG